MSGKVINKKKVIGPDKDVSDIFSQLMGVGGTINMTICYPKYEKIIDLSNKLIKIIKLFYGCIKPECFLNNNIYTIQLNEISAFIRKVNLDLNDLYPEKFKMKNINEMENLSIEEKEEFSNIYEKLKNSELINTFIVICDSIIPYKQYIEDKNNLNHKFILNIPGASFTPFPFTRLNFKNIITFYSTTIEREIKRLPPDIKDPMSVIQIKQNKQYIDYFMLLLNKIYINSFSLYKTISEPDINVDEFTEVILNSIQQIKKHIPRCDLAFSKIEDSVSLLKSNFQIYYKDFIQSKNNTIIIENFILDVSKETKGSPELTRQFRTIISYYRQYVQKVNVKDPKIKMLFDKVNENMDKLSGHKNIVKVEQEDGAKND